MVPLEQGVRMKRPKPDNRPDWRDPNMPVLVQSKSQGQIYIEPERWARVCNARLAMSSEPTFKNDPTYNLRRKPK
jgi:hypothetical protein